MSREENTPTKEHYYRMCDDAYCFVAGLEQVLQENGASDQLRRMGWQMHREVLLKAVEVYREVLKSKAPGNDRYQYRKVVHCKNCKHWSGFGPGETRGICKRWKQVKDAHGYCDEAERSTE